MKDANPNQILERLLLATGSKTEAALAGALGISHQAVYDARKKNTVPPAWVFRAAEKFDVSADWLFFGKGEMKHGAQAPPLPSGASFSHDIVFDVVEAVEEYLQSQNRNLSPSDKAEVIRQICQLVVEHEAGEGQIKPAQMLRIINGALASNG